MSEIQKFVPNKIGEEDCGNTLLDLIDTWKNSSLGEESLSKFALIENYINAHTAAECEKAVDEYARSMIPALSNIQAMLKQTQEHLAEAHAHLALNKAARPAHETIVREGPDLVCTACGTTVTEPVGKPDAYLVPSILSFKGTIKTSCPIELQPQLEGTVMWGAELYSDGDFVVDRDGAEYHAVPLYRATQAFNLTDEQIAEVWQSMPGGPNAWLSQWGYLTFARALFAAAGVKP